MKVSPLFKPSLEVPGWLITFDTSSFEAVNVGDVVAEIEAIM